MTFDKMPHIGQADGIYFAYGYLGHGVTIASKLGYEAGQLIAGKRDRSIFMDIKHPRYFFSTWDKLFMPIVCAGYRLLDKIY
jgi:glycine/D-amino acid oxidase-like deaminating enzyme